MNREEARLSQRVLQSCRDKKKIGKHNLKPMTKENYSDKEPDSFYGSQVKRVSQKN